MSKKTKKAVEKPEPRMALHQQCGQHGIPVGKNECVVCWHEHTEERVGELTDEWVDSLPEWLAAKIDRDSLVDAIHDAFEEAGEDLLLAIQDEEKK